eukprot:CAMPEP_0170210404 /NCGR_PEP_ID=MMETSP0116_2-20130129/4808_1 /TAXON_ID=400756 /ORGANISM="Durinskia baltica, Strain CSIRO CS-38" /LENGTH=153 /DNA_ID=CAMNT_0010460919 /DNA_START=490 /DNA_END=948 /DNA_ORIENTATION=-
MTGDAGRQNALAAVADTWLLAPTVTGSKMSIRSTGTFARGITTDLFSPSPMYFAVRILGCSSMRALASPGKMDLMAKLPVLWYVMTKLAQTLARGGGVSSVQDAFGWQVSAPSGLTNSISPPLDDSRTCKPWQRKGRSTQAAMASCTVKRVIP